VYPKREWLFYIPEPFGCAQGRPLKFYRGCGKVGMTVLSTFPQPLRRRRRCVFFQREINFPGLPSFVEFIKIALMSRNHDCSLGKKLTTRESRSISRCTRSSPLKVRKRL
jgi:hypothetical protein